MKLATLADALKERYASADPRSLGVFRIVLAAVLFCDVLRRFPEIETHFSNSGWLSNHFMLFRPMSDYLFSVYLAFSTPDEVRFLMLVHLALCVLFGFGYRTRLMHVLLVILTVSINSRNLMLENGGAVVLTLLTVWTSFLPLGERFSVDALKRSFRLRRENSVAALNDRTDPPRRTAPVVSLAVSALILQWAVIYAFNVVQKWGPEWRDGTAFHYLLSQDSLLSGFGFWLRDALPLAGIQAASYGALLFEGLIVVLLLSPVATGKARMVAWALAAVLHLSIAAIVDLGAFSWAMLAMFVVLLPAEGWHWFERRFGGRFAASELAVDPGSGFWLSFAGVVKRFDVLGRVRFVPVVPERATAAPVKPENSASQDEEEDEGEEAGEGNGDADDGEEDSDAEAAREPPSGRANPNEPLERLVLSSLVVVDPLTSSRFLGMSGLRQLSRSIPGGFLLVAPATLPGLRGLVERRLARAARDRESFDEYFEVERLAHEPERRPPDPAPYQLGLRQVISGAREAAVLLVAVACGMQLLFENPAVPPWLKPRRPEWARALVVYPRLFQGWTMFAPSPPKVDGRLVIDGITRDGKPLDPLTGRAPVFAVRDPESPAMSQTWGELHRRIPRDEFKPYLDNFKDFIRRHHEVSERPEQALSSFQGWYVSRPIAAPGEPPRELERRLLFSEGTPPAANSPAKPGAGPARTR